MDFPTSIYWKLLYARIDISEKKRVCVGANTCD